MIKEKGFTVVELLIVVVVMGILAAIAIISYNGIQKRAVESMIKSDLHNAAQQMELDKVVSGDAYAATLPVGIRPSAGVSLSLANGGSTPVYSSLNPVQNALLLLDTCTALIAEGVGARPSDNHDYVSECRIYNKNSLNVNGWNGRDINVPITTTSLQGYVSSYSGGQKEEFTTKAGEFMTQLASRFQAAGGVFPVSGFWDSWATPTNGGVMKPILPAPTMSGGGSDGTNYCIDAVSERVASIQWHIRQNGIPTSGSCT